MHKLTANASTQSIAVIADVEYLGDVVAASCQSTWILAILSFESQNSELRVRKQIKIVYSANRKPEARKNG